MIFLRMYPYPFIDDTSTAPFTLSTAPHPVHIHAPLKPSLEATQPSRRSVFLVDTVRSGPRSTVPQWIVRDVAGESNDRAW